MSILSIKHVFGIECSLDNSIFYLNEHCYLYRSSRYIILYNIDSKSQHLIDYGNQFDKIELLSVSPNKEYLGIVLNTLNKSRIIIYDIKRKKILLLKQTIRSIDILSMNFSINSKFLLTL
jgi:hypothetical protein